MRRQIYPYLPPMPSAREQDYQLAYESLHGDSSAWETLYQNAFSFVLHEVKRFDDQNVFSPGDHYDNTDEPFARCYEQLDRYQGLSRFQRWVLGYAKNIMRSRRSKCFTAQRNQYLLQRMEQSRAIYLDPLTFLLRLERDQFLWMAFYQLSSTDQIILRRRVFCNTPPRQLAKELQLTRKQVLQRYEDALLAVQHHFLRLYR